MNNAGRSLLTGGVLLLNSSAAHSGVYKCTDASGKTTFQQQPCPEHSTSGTVSLQSGNWTRVGTARIRPNTGSQILWDTDLDEARLKRIGANILATFRIREYHREDLDHRQPRTYYALYDCDRGMVAGPSEEAEQLGQPGRDGYPPPYPFEPYATYQKLLPDLVFGEPAVVARICK